MKQFGMPPLSTNPTISEQFFHDHPLCPNFKNENVTPDFFFFWGGWGEETMLGHDYWNTNILKLSHHESQIAI